LHHQVLRRHQAALARAERWFKRFGVWLLTFGYFVPGARHVSAITAGVASLEYRRFAKAAYPGAVLWSGVYLGLGYMAGDRWETIARLMPGRLATVVLAIAVGVAIVVVAARQRRRRLP
jgi:membrane protein DedA with SNARE-associated domain